MEYLSQFQNMMKAAGMSELVIKSFFQYYLQVREGKFGFIPENDIMLPDTDNIFSYEKLSPGTNSHLDKLAVIKLNGGLGTSMGLKKAKSLLMVKDGLNFLDIISKQILYLRDRTRINIPLIFMHSFNTREDSLQHLSQYENLKIKDLPFDFVQNKFPRIYQKDLSPVMMKDSTLNWSPPGHGEIYLVLHLSGILNLLLDHGIEYLFISNSDNLGAVVDRRILDFIISRKIPFLMEVCKRTEQDKKGGHLAQNGSGQLILREVAQCQSEDLAAFQDIKKYKYFNTNNLWINLKVLKQSLVNYNYLLPLPLILNAKTVGTGKVFQIESAMGAAIGIFPGSKALVVDRNRFIPVKKTDDLLLIRSDAYSLSDNSSLKLHPDLTTPPLVKLDPEYYNTLEQLEEHFAEGVPSLIKCQQLEIQGDVSFGKNIQFHGNVKLNTKNPLLLENQIISGSLEL